jgi:hypothetical protein
MPECIVTIPGGKKFRTKPFWRAMATEYHLNTEVVSEVFVDLNDGDWGYKFMCRATAPNGRYADGDGTCTASEKVDRDGNPTKMQTHHNVRSHAKTRATNRAISDLIAFGEVSADELGPDAYDEPPNTAPREAAPPQAAPAPSGNGTLSKARIKSLGIWRAGFAASEAVHGKGEKAKWNSINWALDRMGFDKVDEVPDERGEELVSLIAEYPQHQAGDEINF